MEPKIVLLSGFSDKEIHMVINHYRIHPALPKPIFAMATPFNKEWKLKRLIRELWEEQKALKSGLKNR